ncbi:MAG TPA: isoprenylcysteine carboxylmethyltransferase family protein [Candidatus Limnocylindria bacterium]|nr:isoprenylcysteine carboxylmethyltransferase family protein [Candidatus Limnocylindria bacterium]
MLPFVIGGLILNVAFPAFFAVGGPPPTLRAVSILVLIPGVAIWIWSVVLILRNVPSGRLITTGPYAWVKHPLYTDVALLVLPWIGFLLNTWLGAALGVILYIGDRMYAPQEEAELRTSFGDQWDAYASGVKLPWA